MTPRNGGALEDFLVLEAVRATDGTVIAVSDEDLLREVGRLAATEGTFICPEGAACMAVVRRLYEERWLTRDEQVVVLNTGAGLKYPDTVPAEPAVLSHDG